MDKVAEKQRQNLHLIFIRLLTPQNETLADFSERMRKSAESFEMISPQLANLVRDANYRKEIASRILALYPGEYNHSAKIVGILRAIEEEAGADLQLPAWMLSRIHGVQS